MSGRIDAAAASMGETFARDGIERTIIFRPRLPADGIVKTA